MPRSPESNGNSPKPFKGATTGQPQVSTTWVMKRVKIRSAPEGASKNGAAGGRWFRTAKRNPREKLTLTIHYRGGPEAWYEVRARGAVGRFHGATALHDMMQEINLGEMFWSDRT